MTKPMREYFLDCVSFVRSGLSTLKKGLTDVRSKIQASFNFEEFKNQAIADMQAGKSLVGKDGVFTPLMKEFLEAALELMEIQGTKQGLDKRHVPNRNSL